MIIFSVVLVKEKLEDLELISTRSGSCIRLVEWRWIVSRVTSD